MKNALLFSIALLMFSCEVIVIDEQIDRRDRITGSYQLREYSESYNATVRYSIFITKVGYGNDIFIENLYDAGVTVQARLSGDKIYIPWQVVDGYEIEGVGTVYGSQISLNYNVTDTYSGWRTDYCRGDAWR